MANKYPYVASAGPLVKTITHLRRSFPKEVTADTLRKLGVAPKNESYAINVLRFLGVIDDEGKKVDAKAKAFVQHQDEAFSSEFEKLVRDSYEELFELHGDAAWKLDRGSLTQFFRTTDHSTDVVGTRQAGTFAALAALSGHADVPTPKSAASPKKTKSSTDDASKKKAAPSKKSESSVPSNGGADGSGSPPVGLTVRIEVNLPASGDQETYDRIFQSIRKNLINGS
ncbi:DUF5343 domain-containing protein [Acidithiobacillus ferridurans]|uniref:DUF5343 domain-containing protein n=1 Tax=Acidithiobacillus ferridurans TaxID=1232575 RepID=UPI001C06ED79|nr:DUF5343 domain-containing protein [Acidithiobacillus ferridurans]MBU2803814.1 DUF5343 domain-containing protein [Acidithiobacillus ferridurans]